MAAPDPNTIILYDGVCGLCNRLVQFLLNRDLHDRFRFASLQSEFAADILRRHNTSPDNLDTMYVVLNYDLSGERIASRSDAAVVALRELGGGWATLSAALRLVPLRVRNRGYNLVSRNRYRIFGRYDSCPIPSEKDRDKFLDQQ
jgi:predicted DCC family thiol-disulfide oxidoreductase YuxK